MRAEELMSDAMRDSIEGDALVTAACVVFAYIDENGEQQLATSWDEDSWFTTREGMVRALLRDVLAVPDAALRRFADAKLDEDD